MCTPALYIAQAALAAVQQSQNARAQQKFGQQQFDLNKQTATDAAVSEYAALQARQQQEHAKAAQSIDAAHQATLRKLGTFRATTAAAGVGGNDAALAADEFRQAELEYQTTVSRNTAMLDNQFGAELQGTRLQLQGRILSGMPGPTQQPDILGTLLAGAGQAFAFQYKMNQTQPVVNDALGSSGIAPQFHPGFYDANING